MNEVSGFGVIHKSSASLRYGTSVNSLGDIKSGMHNVQRQVLMRYPSKTRKPIDKTPRPKKYAPNSRKAPAPRYEASDSLKGAYFRDAKKAADAGTVKPKFVSEASPTRNSQGRFDRFTPRREEVGDLANNLRLR